MLFGWILQLSMVRNDGRRHLGVVHRKGDVWDKEPRPGSGRAAGTGNETTGSMPIGRFAVAIPMSIHHEEAWLSDWRIRRSNAEKICSPLCGKDGSLMAADGSRKSSTVIFKIEMGTYMCLPPRSIRLFFFPKANLDQVRFVNARLMNKATEKVGCHRR